MESLKTESQDDEAEVSLSKTTRVGLDSKYTKNKLFQTMNSSMEDMLNSELISGKKFDYKETETTEPRPQAATSGIWNIYFYMSEETKIKKTTGIQFITDRYLARSKEFYKSTIQSQSVDEDYFKFEEHQSQVEESKDTTPEDETDRELKRLKFEKYILLILLGSCDLADHWVLKEKYENDFKEIIYMMKINKINELKRLNKNSINYEILVDMVKDPINLQDFTDNWLPELKRETWVILQEADDKLSNLLRASELLELQIEILKTDIENLDFIKWNELRMKFIKTVEIPVWVHYWTDSPGFKITDTEKCPEWQKERQKAQNNIIKGANISSQDIFFKDINKVMQKYNEAEELAKKEEDERRTFRHECFTNVDEFMKKFFSLPIFTMTGNEPLEELKLISHAYKGYVDKLKAKVQENVELKK